MPSSDGNGNTNNNKHFNPALGGNNEASSTTSTDFAPAFRNSSNTNFNNSNASFGSSTNVVLLPGMEQFILQQGGHGGSVVPAGAVITTVGGPGAAPGQVQEAQPPPPPPPLQSQQQQHQQPPRQELQGEWSEYGMTQQQYDHFLAVFMTFDEDGSNALDAGESSKLLKFLNYVHSDRDAARVFAEMDSYKRGRVKRSDFFAWLAANKPDSMALYGVDIETYHSYLFAFHELDNGRRGSIDLERFRRLALRFRFANTFPEADALFQMIDVDRSRSVSLHELLVFLKHRASGGGGQRMMPAPLQQQHHHHHHHSGMMTPAQQQQQQQMMMMHHQQQQFVQYQAPTSQPIFRTVNNQQPGQQQAPPPATQRKQPQNKDGCCMQ